MKNKIILLLLTVLFITSTVTLYETDKKYSHLKDQIKKKNAIMQNQASFINKKNLDHEIKIKKNKSNIDFKIVKDSSLRK